jgi:molybdate transport system ATP-binding protein
MCAQTNRDGSTPPVSREFLALENASVRSGARRFFRKTSWVWRTDEYWAILAPDDAGTSVFCQMLAEELPLAEGELRGPAGPRDTARGEPVVYLSPDSQRRLASRESSFYQSRWHSGIQEGQQTVNEFLSQESVEQRNPYQVDVRKGSQRSFLQDRARYVRWLGIRKLFRRKLAYLSNGELRKTLLVWALLKRPQILLLEDPFAGLDTSARRDLQRVVKRLMRNGMRVLVSTSRPEEIPDPVTHLLILYRGRVLSQGPRDTELQVWQKHFGAQDHGLDPNRHGPVPRRRAPKSVGARVLVELRGVSVSADRGQILKEISWTIREGERWVLLGRNGAGKTTLLNLIQGDHPQVYAQDVRLFGKRTDSTRNVWQARKHLGWMSPELHHHYPGGWEVAEVVCSGYFNTVGLYERCSAAQKRAAMKCLRALGLERKASIPFGELSFGQQRLVLLARAVVKQPRLLILDEPCQGLDASQRRVLLAAVDRLLETTGGSLVFVTHHAGEWPSCVTHRTRMRKGRVAVANRLA